MVEQIHPKRLEILEYLARRAARKTGNTPSIREIDGKRHLEVVLTYGATRLGGKRASPLS